MLEQPRTEDVGGHFRKDSAFFGIFGFPGGVIVVKATAITRAYTCIGGVPGFREVVSARGKRKTRGPGSRVVARGTGVMVHPRTGVVPRQGGGGRSVLALQQHRIITKVDNLMEL